MPPCSLDIPPDRRVFGIAPAAAVVAAAAARIAAAAAETESYPPLPARKQTDSGRNIECHASHACRTTGTRGVHAGTKPSQAEPSQAKPSQAKASQAKPSKANQSQVKPSKSKPSQAQQTKERRSKAKQIANKKTITCFKTLSYTTRLSSPRPKKTQRPPPCWIRQQRQPKNGTRGPAPHCTASHPIPPNRPAPQPPPTLCPPRTASPSSAPQRHPPPRLASSRPQLPPHRLHSLLRLPLPMRPHPLVC